MKMKKSKKSVFFVMILLTALVVMCGIKNTAIYAEAYAGATYGTFDVSIPKLDDISNVYNFGRIGEVSFISKENTKVTFKAFIPEDSILVINRTNTVTASCIYNKKSSVTLYNSNGNPLFNSGFKDYELGSTETYVSFVPKGEISIVVSGNEDLSYNDKFISSYFAGAYIPVSKLTEVTQKLSDDRSSMKLIMQNRIGTNLKEIQILKGKYDLNMAKDPGMWKQNYDKDYDVFESDYEGYAYNVYANGDYTIRLVGKDNSTIGVTNVYVNGIEKNPKTAGNYKVSLPTVTYAGDNYDYGKIGDVLFQNGSNTDISFETTLQKDSIVVIQSTNRATSNAINKGTSLFSVYNSKGNMIYSKAFDEIENGETEDYVFYAQKGKIKMRFDGSITGAKASECMILNVSGAVIPVSSALKVTQKPKNNYREVSVLVPNVLGSKLKSIQMINGEYSARVANDKTVWEDSYWENGFSSFEKIGESYKADVYLNGSYTIRLVGENDETLASKIIKVKKVDKVAPVIKGVTNGKKYKKSVTITCSDKLSGISYATLNGNKIKNGAKVSKAGQYYLYVYDKAGNEAYCSFIIEK